MPDYSNLDKKTTRIYLFGIAWFGKSQKLPYGQMSVFGR